MPVFVELNLPPCGFQFRNDEGTEKIFDRVRKKYVVVTPEEWVRQHFINYLVHEKKFPISLMAVEKQMMVNNQARRFDLLIYDRKGNPFLVAEFKSPSVKIAQDSFDQAVMYNSRLRVPYILVSNGLNHFICHVDYDTNSVEYLQAIPEFNG